MSVRSYTTPFWRSPLWVIVAGSLIAMIGFGVRSSMGLFIEPITLDRAWNRETIALALAIQNLLWGIGLPIAGALSDKFGSTKVIGFGAVMYACGVYAINYADTPLWLHASAGVVTGIGVAFTAFSLAIAAMAKVVDSSKRSLVLGVGTAAGSAGQVVFSPLTQALISQYGWNDSLTVLALCTLFLLPLAMLLPTVASSYSQLGDDRQSLRQALGEALGHRGYVLLTFGFFVCGFHVAFIAVHLPAYVIDIGLAPQVGAYALAIVGLANIFGSFFAGMIGHKYNKSYSLALLYFARSATILWLIYTPVSTTTIYIFSCVMGLLWLSTVPLTTGIVAQVFGVRYMATLFGIVFFSHQIGSFIGIWLGGRWYDSTGSYDAMWWAGVAMGLFATAVHLPINEKPLPRLSQQAT